MAVHADRLFVPISDTPDGGDHTEAARPGLYALDLLTGRFLWKAPLDKASCDGRGETCDVGLVAAPAATDDIVMTGGGDGWLRFYDGNTGQVVWKFDTTQPVKTVSGGVANGGSFGAGASLIAYDGNVIVESGYGVAGRMPGNALLVFTAR
jgi:polyvinyl alcohol dehydrogenase (cytochrome)